MPAVWNNTQIVSNLLRAGTSWSGPAVTFSFPSTAPSWAGGERNGFSAFTTAQKDMGRLALGLWDDLADIDFVEVASGGQINMSNTTSSIGYAHAYFPGSGSISGSLWLNPTYNSGWGTNDLVTPKIGQWGALTYIHELGHALGLDHPGNYNGGSPTYSQNALYTMDTIQYTVMSYFDADNTGADWTASDGRSYYAQTPMLHDILAIQQLYGVEMSTRTGDTVYGFNSNTDRPAIFDFTINEHPILTIWDAGGNDWLDLSGFSTSSRIDLNPGTYSDCDGMTKNIAIAYNCFIENAAGGSGNDSIIGNNLDNTLRGNDGNDLLVGGGGADILVGGDGNDIFYADLLDLLNLFSGGLGYDILNISGTLEYAYDFAANGFEEIHYNVSYGGGGGSGGGDPPPPPTPVVLDGTILADTLTGAGGNDTLCGLDGNDKLYGLDGDDLLNGGAGSDVMAGGLGVDTVTYEDAAAGVIVNLASSKAQSTVGSGKDTLTGIENLVGSIHNDTLTGSAVANTLEGLEGNDTLNGGLGADTMIGGDGNDTYYVDNIGDIVDESASGSATTAAASIAGDGMCNCPFCAGLTPHTSTPDDHGVDKVMSSISFSLADDTRVLGDVENLTLTGSAAINGTGNDFDNIITGNTGNNILDGADGTDTLSFAGLTRAATVNLAVNTAQFTGYGYDTILNFENITGGSGVDNFTGDGGDNVLSGGAGNDTLSGGAGEDTLVGGAGRDLLTGGADADTFVFTALTDSGGKNLDTITDFEVGSDRIDLSAIDAMTGLGDESFTFNGSGPFVVGVKGLLQVTTTTTQTFVQGDVNGDGKADFKIVLTGVHALQESDFIL